MDTISGESSLILIFVLFIKKKIKVQIGNTMIDEWLKDLEHNRVKETRAFNRRTYIQRKQRVLSHFYESKIVQYIVAALIVMNFFIEAFRQVAIL